LRLESNQRVGLVGESGAGKSTLFALLQRFYDAQSGKILIDGQEVTRVTQDSLRSAIAFVPQDISLFQRSIMENIRYGRPDATDREVLQAAAAARCEFINELPGGFTMVVGDRGAKLSGGQRQRIAIARAFLKDSPILLLDEATASLDSDSEEAVREALGRLIQRRTVIAIAHRLSTLRNFDRIIVEIRSGNRRWFARRSHQTSGNVLQTAMWRSEPSDEACGIAQFALVPAHCCRLGKRCSDPESWSCFRRYNKRDSIEGGNQFLDCTARLISCLRDGGTMTNAIWLIHEAS
jgi:ABC-type transport system involved in cytochrome bd biosynthesis fused ATPase/permease subunit